MRRETVLFVSGLLTKRRGQRGSRRGRRALSPFKQAVLVLRWFLDATRMRQLADDNGIGLATCYRYLHETINVLAERAPKLGDVLAQAVEAELTHVNLDGIVLATDRVAAPGPNGADRWWSGKHKHHGGNIQVLSAPDGWPLWVSPVRPGREHDVTCARHHGMIEDLGAVRDKLLTLADLGYEGEADTVTTPVKKRTGQRLSDDQRTYNRILRGVRGLGERANAVLTSRFKALRHISLDPWRIGAITTAALALLHHENDWTLTTSHNAVFAH